MADSELEQIRTIVSVGDIVDLDLSTGDGRRSSGVLDCEGMRVKVENGARSRVEGHSLLRLDVRSHRALPFHSLPGREVSRPIPPVRSGSHRSSQELNFRGSADRYFCRQRKYFGCETCSMAIDLLSCQASAAVEQGKALIWDAEHA